MTSDIHIHTHTHTHVQNKQTTTTEKGAFLSCYLVSVQGGERRESESRFVHAFFFFFNSVRRASFCGLGNSLYFFFFLCALDVVVQPMRLLATLRARHALEGMRWGGKVAHLLFVLFFSSPFFLQFSSSVLSHLFSLAVKQHTRHVIN